MSSESLKFMLKISLFSILIFIIAKAVYTTALSLVHFDAFIYQLAVVTVVTALGHLLIIKSTEKSDKNFTNGFIGSITIKLLAYMFFMFLYLWFDNSQAIAFLINFMILYVIFTLFEISVILRYVKKIS